MNDRFQSVILRATGADAITKQHVIQRLWSGYGKIARIHLRGGRCNSVVIKHVHWPTAQDHPRGWNTGLSHERKVRSYEVETRWYDQWSARCDQCCRIPHSLALDSDGDEFLLVLEDLDTTGFSGRRQWVSAAEISACLTWLAHFHATFLGDAPHGLWPTGTYWHLATRPDEMKVLAQEDPALHAAAEAIDRRLNEASFQTLVHGDAKLANFCFSADGLHVAAVDFQYVGGGCGMKDVAYFLGSCLDETECERQEAQLLELYFSALRKALALRRPDTDLDAVEQEWRALYPVAWTDFHRFLKGWSPGHWKINDYSERVAQQVVANLKGSE
ncbi:MAG: phosphotransferase [Pontiellaceae bacterium]|nr:phosphotransferase [Pontiellaceae bacterium]